MYYDPPILMRLSNILQNNSKYWVWILILRYFVFHWLQEKQNLESKRRKQRSKEHREGDRETCSTMINFKCPKVMVKLYHFVIMGTKTRPRAPREQKL